MTYSLGKINAGIKNVLSDMLSYLSYREYKTTDYGIFYELGELDVFIEDETPKENSKSQILFCGICRRPIYTFVHKIIQGGDIRYYRSRILDHVIQHLTDKSLAKQVSSPVIIKFQKKILSGEFSKELSFLRLTDYQPEEFIAAFIDHFRTKFKEIDIPITDFEITE